MEAVLLILFVLAAVFVVLAALCRDPTPPRHLIDPHDWSEGLIDDYGNYPPEDEDDEDLDDEEDPYEEDLDDEEEDEEDLDDEEDEEEDEDEEEGDVGVYGSVDSVSIVVSGGSSISNVRAGGGRLHVGRVEVHGSESRIGGARIINDREGTRIILEEGCRFEGVVNGVRVNVYARPGEGRKVIAVK